MEQHRQRDPHEAEEDDAGPHLGDGEAALELHYGGAQPSVGAEELADHEAPLEFVEKYVTIPFGDYVCLVDDPRPSSPRGATLTVDYLGNVVEAPLVTYLNVEVDTMKELAAKAIVGGEPVWFGCDVGPMMRRDLGIWDAALYALEGVYDTRFGLDKADRLVYR